MAHHLPNRRGDHSVAGWLFRIGGSWPGLVATAAFGAIWGGLLARVLAEVWPIGPAGLNWGPCWLWSPLPAIVLALLGALGALLLCANNPSSGVRRGRLAAGWAAATLSWPLALGILYLAQPAVAPFWGVGALIAGLGGTLWLRNRARSTVLPSASAPKGIAALGLGWDLLAFAPALALYIATLAPSVLPGDSGEFQFVAPMLGIPHPTGYPLYLVLGKLFSLVPLQSVAYRLNLLSAVAAAGAAWAVYRSGRALGMRRSASLLSAGLLAVSETFWSQAVIAEKYTLNAFFVALTLYLGLQWRRARLYGVQADNRASAGNSIPADMLLSAWAVCYGLGLAHHRTMILLAPAYLYLVWSTDRRALSRSVLHVLRLALLVLLPLSLYLLLLLFSARQPPYAYIRLDSLRAFLDLVLARTYQGALFRGGWAALPGRAVEFGRLASREFGPMGLALAVIGWVVLARREKRVAWMLAIGIAAQALFALNYYVPNAAVYALPVYVWLAVCVGPAIEAIRDALARPFGRLRARPFGGLRAQPGIIRVGVRQRSSRGGGTPQPTPNPVWPHVALAWILLAAALPIGLLTARYPGMDQRRAYSRLAFGHTYGQIAALSVEPGALLVSDWLPATVLWYTQWVEGLFPSAQIAVIDPLEGQWAGPVGNALASGRPVYLARPVAAAGDRHPLTSAGPLVRVLSAPVFSPPEMSHPALEPAERGTEIRLLGSDLAATLPGAEGAVYAPGSGPTSGVIQGGSTLHVTVYWQAVRPPAGDYGVTVRLVDPAGHSLLERRNRHPVGGTYPTSRWQAGEVVGDYYALALPPYLPSGEVRLLAFLEAPSSGDDLSGAGDPVLSSLATLSVQKPLRWQNPDLGTPARRLFEGGLLLVGYDAPRELVPNETVSVALQWLVCAPGPTEGSGFDSRPLLLLVSRDGAESVLAPYPGSRDDWQPGALVVDRYLFSIPEDFAYAEVRARGGQEGRRTGVTHYRLPLRVTSEPAHSAIFGGVIRLRDYAYGTRSFKPGATVHLTLEWEAMGTMDEAYKVFVHVLGQDGLPIAQQDNEPQNGTYPTTRWQRGERVADPYAIRLPDELPPGEYAVEVGLYRISDLSRLPVLGRDGAVIDDKVFLTPIIVK
jgi:hypothetical protein